MCSLAGEQCELRASDGGREKSSNDGVSCRRRQRRCTVWYAAPHVPVPPWDVRLQGTPAQGGVFEALFLARTRAFGFGAGPARSCSPPYLVRCIQTMAQPRARCLLWVALILFLPVPYWAFGPGRVPTVWLLELFGLGLALVMTEGVDGSSGALALVFGVQTLAWLGLLRLLSVLILRIGRRLAGANRLGTIALLTFVALALAALTPLYVTPFVSDGGPVSWLNLFL